MRFLLEGVEIEKVVYAQGISQEIAERVDCLVQIFVLLINLGLPRFQVLSPPFSVVCDLAETARVAALQFLPEAPSARTLQTLT